MPDAGVVAPDDEVGAAVVLAADRVPDRLARPGVAHRGGEHADHRAVLRVVALEQRLVAPHPHVRRDVVGLRRADERVDEQAVDDLERALLDVLVRPVDRVAGLEPDDGPPAALARTSARVSRGRQAVVRRSRRAPAARAPRACRRRSSRPRRTTAFTPGWLEVVGPVDRRRPPCALSRLNGLGHAEHRDRLGALGRRRARRVRPDPRRCASASSTPSTTGIAQASPSARCIVVEDRVVVGLALEAGERAEGARRRASPGRRARARSTISFGRFAASARERVGGVAAWRAGRRGCRRAARSGAMSDMTCRAFRSGETQDAERIRPRPALGHDPERLARELDLEAAVVARASRRRPAPGTGPSAVTSTCEASCA